MKQSNQIVLALFLGTSKAIKLNQQEGFNPNQLAQSELPPYWDGEYSNTWEHTKHPRFVNATRWENDSPKGYEVSLV